MLKRRRSTNPASKRLRISGTRMRRMFEGRSVITIVRMRPMRAASRVARRADTLQRHSPRRKSHQAQQVERRSADRTNRRQSFAPRIRPQTNQEQRELIVSERRFATGQFRKHLQRLRIREAASERRIYKRSLTSQAQMATERSILPYAFTAPKQESRGVRRFAKPHPLASRKRP